MNKQLKELQLRQRKLAKQMAEVGFIWPGSISKRYTQCGQSKCACKSDDKYRHGPYVYWTTKLKGRTVAKLLSEREAKLISEWIQNRKMAEKLFVEMKKLSERARKAILKENRPFLS